MQWDGRKSVGVNYGVHCRGVIVIFAVVFLAYKEIKKLGIVVKLGSTWSKRQNYFGLDRSSNWTPPRKIWSKF